jgi:hypothetical protein
MHYHSKNKANWGIDQNYKDLDGNTKSFSIINHDPKSTIFTGIISTVEKNKEEIILSEEEILCHNIIDSEHSEDPDFIKKVDDILIRNGIERYNKYKPLDYNVIYRPQIPELLLQLKELWDTLKN